MSRRKPLSKRNGQNKVAIADKTVAQHHVWAGPLPDPDSLKKYDPNTAQTIVAMAEKEQSFRHEYELKGQSSAFLRERRAQIFAFVIDIAALLGGIYLMTLEHTKVAVALIAVALLMIIGSSIIGGVLFWLRRRENPK